MNAPVFLALAPSPDRAAGILLRMLSLGAGVQSTTLALMAAHGEISPMPDCAIFADTGWEPKAVYEHLAWLRSPNVLPFPVHIVSAGNLRADIIAGAQGERWASIPAFTRNVTAAGTVVPVYDEDENGEPIIVGSRTLAAERVEIGMIRRQCTNEYKIVPIRRKVRELLGIAGRRSPTALVAEQWIGISLDEAVRVKPSFEDWQVNRCGSTACVGWNGMAIPNRQRAPASAARSIPTSIGGTCVTTTPTRGPMPCRLIVQSAQGSAAFAAKSIFIARPCRSTKPTSRLPPIADSSISG
jgi:hypothetical protein